MKTPLSRQPSIVVIGGGTGTFHLLSALKTRTSHLTALVNMADSGGSSGILRDELGVLPPGDVRQCLVALSTAPEELRQLFSFRFPEGTFEGHSFGNLFLSAVERMTNNFEDAVRMAGDVLRIKGQVLPITLTDCQLVMRQGDKKIVGEYQIAYESTSPANRPDLSLQPKAELTAASRSAIEEAQLVVIAPGNLYASLAASMLVDGVGDALATTSAPVVFVCNLVNKPNHTQNFAVDDYVAELERFAGREFLDYVLYNTDEPDPALLHKYALDGEYPVNINDDKLTDAHYQAIGGPFLSRAEQSSTGSGHSGFFKRSLIRHNGEAVVDALLELLRHQQ
jgi:uncharacterized cofD-like protein